MNWRRRRRVKTYPNFLMYKWASFSLKIYFLLKYKYTQKFMLSETFLHLVKHRFYTVISWTSVIFFFNLEYKFSTLYQKYCNAKKQWLWKLVMTNSLQMQVKKQFISYNRWEPRIIASLVLVLNIRYTVSSTNRNHLLKGNLHSL